MPLHPQVQALLEMVKEQGIPPLHEGTVADARALTAAIKDLIGPGPDVAEIRDLKIPTPDGAIPARLYHPTSERAPGLVVYFHGGGWVIGALDDFDAVCQMLAVGSGCDVLSVDYRLAPEHRFPAAPDDAFAALRWAADELSDRRPIVVGGDSAGGNLAAVAARRARDDGGPALVMQLLAYPVTDHDFDTSSYREHGASGYLLGREEMIWFWDHYLPDASGRSDPNASPLRAAELAGLPPAHVIIAEYDPLRDEGLAYAERLAEAGVKVDVDRYDDVTHGFFTMVNYFERGDQAVATAADAIRDAIVTPVKG
jgi:acetyl esterase/lipase